MMKRTAAVLGIFSALVFPVAASAEPSPTYPCSPGTLNMYTAGMGGVAQEPVWASYDKSGGNSVGGPTLDALQVAYFASCPP